MRSRPLTAFAGAWRTAWGCSWVSLPLGLYNWWAFGSPTHLSYEENQVEPVGGIFGVGVPSLSALYDLFFSAWGLCTNMPVLVLGVVGAVMLLKRWRAEALVLLAVPAVGLLHDTSLQFSPFGGLGLPRYLIYTMPFVASASLPPTVAFR